MSKAGRDSKGRFKKGSAEARKQGKKGHAASCGLFGAAKSRKKRR